MGKGYNPTDELRTETIGASASKSEKAFTESMAQVRHASVSEYIRGLVLLDGAKASHPLPGAMGTYDEAFPPWVRRFYKEEVHRIVSADSDGPRGAERRAKTMEWRRKKGSDTWHWCVNCSNWPTANYEVSHAKPTSGELDNECKAKDAAGDCKKA